MGITREIGLELEKEETLIDQVRLMHDRHQLAEILHSRDDEAKVVVEPGIAMIQCFFGTNIHRIKATVTAIEFNLLSTTLPEKWVFVEMQTRKEDLAFQWLSRHGIDYIPIVVPEKDDTIGILNKHSLWNAGVASLRGSGIDRYCFVDSDVVMCDSQWLAHAVEAFKTHDVLSLSSHVYYSENALRPIQETIGYSWATRGDTTKSHCGMSLGLTERAFQMIGGLRPSVILDDVMTFTKIVGKANFRTLNHWHIPFSEGDGDNGLPLRLGYAEGVVCHVWHGDDQGKYQSIIGMMKKCGIRSMSEIIEVPKSPIACCTSPEDYPSLIARWRKNEFRSELVKKVVLDYYCGLTQGDGVEDGYLREMKKRMVPLKDRRFFVFTSIDDPFASTPKAIIDFKREVEMRLWEFSPVVVFLINDGSLKVVFDQIPDADINYILRWGDGGIDETIRSLLPAASTGMFIPFKTKSLGDIGKHAASAIPLNSEYRKSPENLSFWFSNGIGLAGKL